MKIQRRKILLPILAAAIGICSAFVTTGSPSKLVKQAWGRNAANQCVSGNVDDDCGLTSGTACTFTSGGQSIQAHDSEANCNNSSAVLRRP